MSKIEIIKNKAPALARPEFSVDGRLAKKLDHFEVTKLMNKSNFTLYLGKAGSGKTSMLVSMLNTPSLFKGVFHNVFLFMGKNSRDSIKGSFFDKEVPPEDIFDELTFENLNAVYDKIRDDAEEGYKSLIIMDDVQRQMKDSEVQKLLLHLVNNRRHLKSTLFLANQNYKSLPKQVRMVLTNLFVWKVNKKEFESLFEEQVEMHKDRFLDVLSTLYKDPHDFLFIDTSTQRIFDNFDEIVIKE
jgi:hypothetical protein